MAEKITANEKNKSIDEALKIAYEALKEKGYDPLVQLTGFMFTGDPTYITPHNNARELIVALDVDEIGYRLFEVYFKD